LNKRHLRYLLSASIAAAVSVPTIARSQTAPAAAAPATKPATQPAVDPNKVVITIGDTSITAAEFEQFVADLDPAQQQQVISRPDGRRRLAEEIVKLKLLASEARKRKLDESPRTKIVYEQVLANALTTDLAEQKGAGEQYFNEHKDEFDKISARHILVAVAGGGVEGAKLTDEQAKSKAQDIKKQLDKGGDFAALARTNSDDPGSAQMGGALTPFSRGMMVPPFEQAAFSMKKNEISGPIKTQFGYHIIQVLDRQPGTYDQSKQLILERRLDSLVDQLKESAKPKLDDSFFGPSEKAQSTPGAPAAAAGNK
jgi:peptidyl-prolyl cis-trans isomerase C